MSNAYTLQEVSRTRGVAPISAGLLSSMTLALMVSGSHSVAEPPLTKKYQVAESVATPNVASVFYFVEKLTPVQKALNFEHEMSNFYQTLQGAQESLGSDFEKILVDNLWELYSRS